MGVEKVAFPREFFFVPERTDLNRTDRFERARSFWGFQSFRLLDTSHLFLSPNVVSCSRKFVKISGSMARPDGVPENLKKYLGAVNWHQKPHELNGLTLKFPGENFRETIRNSLR